MGGAWGSLARYASWTSLLLNEPPPSISVATAAVGSTLRAELSAAWFCCCCAGLFALAFFSNGFFVRFVKERHRPFKS